MPLSKDGYTSTIDSLLNIKFKEKIVNQPSYKDLGVDTLYAKNVDVTLFQLIEYYEQKYGIIELGKCDFETSPYTTTTCTDKDKRLTKEQREDIIVEYRNSIILKELEVDERTKIAIIYGANHKKGIWKELEKQGYR